MVSILFTNGYYKMALLVEVKTKETIGSPLEYPHILPHSTCGDANMPLVVK